MLAIASCLLVMGRRGVVVPDALPFGREDHVHKARQECHPQRQVLENLVGVAASTCEEAPLETCVAERHGEEHHGTEEGVHVVKWPEAHLPELAVVDLAVAADDAVGEVEEEGEGGEATTSVAVSHLLAG